MTSTTATTEPTSFKQRLFRSKPEDILPLKIEHQRIYILPTRRGLAYLFSLLIMLIASVNYALSLGYALCFLLTGLFAASLLHTYRNVAGISFQAINADDVFAGENIQFRITMTNASNLDRVGVALKTKNTSSVVDISTANSAQAILNIPTTQRGMHTLGRVTVTSTYPLGLWRTWCYVHSNAKSTIYPTPENSPPPLPSHSVAEQGENQRKASQGDISGLREYHTGDAISSIAWKAAARGQGLFVKTFEEENAGGETYLSLSATGLTDTEQQMSRMAAWVISAERAQADYSFELGDTKLEPSCGPKHKRQALSALATHGLKP